VQKCVYAIQYEQHLSEIASLFRFLTCCSVARGVPKPRVACQARTRAASDCCCLILQDGLDYPLLNEPDCEGA
jgi:hypothetical protein